MVKISGKGHTLIKETLRVFKERGQFFSDRTTQEIMEQLYSALEELKVIKEELYLKTKELEKANTSLREGKNSFQQIFEQSPLGAALLSLDFHFNLVNPKLCHILGYSEQDLLSMGFPDITFPDDLEDDLELVNKLLQGEIDHIDKQQRYIQKDGNPIWTHLTIQLLKDIDGRPHQFLHTMMDITNHKFSEQKLIESEERLRLAFENANDGICLTDALGNHIEVNHRMCKIFGYSKEELENLTVNDITHPEDRYVIQGFIKRCISGEIERTVFEQRYLHKNGNTLWGQVSSSLARDAEGNPLYFISHIQDITQKKLSEGKVGASIEKLRKAMGGIIQAMSLTVEARDPYTSGHQRRVAHLARAIAQEMGLTEDQVDGIRMSGAIHDIGKISVPSEILSKPTKLSDLEFSLIKNHPSVGYDILRDIEFPWPIAQITLQHHERINGSGYPKGISGKEILLESKVLAVADVVEAIASHRPYRPAHTIDVALKEIDQNKGILYEPEVVAACRRVFEEKSYHLN
jgi:PAS domain S-box-containing protein